MNQALAALTGTVEEKQEAIKKAVQDQTSALEIKLALIEAAVSGGFADSEAQQELLHQAVLALKGTAEEKLAAITTAISSQSTTLSAKLDLIETAVKEGFADSNAKAALIKTALASLNGNVNDKLAAISTAIANQTDSLSTKLELIQAALQDSLASANEALGLIGTALSTSLQDGVDAIVAELDSIDTALSSKVSAAITSILNAISGQPDYSSVLAAIQKAVESLKTKTLNGHEYVEMGDGLKWATMNLGATAPYEYGDYFAWGETAPYYEPGHAYDNPCSSWKSGKEYGYSLSSYFDNETDIYGEGKKTVLDIEDDAARANWKSSWRMPTKAEWEWLLNTDNCTWEWTESYQGSGVIGVIVTSKVTGYEGNQLFLPVAYIRFSEILITEILQDTRNLYIGAYWSSALQNGIYNNGSMLLLLADKNDSTYRTYSMDSSMRSWGLTIRPVSE